MQLLAFLFRLLWILCCTIQGISLNQTSAPNILKDYNNNVAPYAEGVNVDFQLTSLKVVNFDDDNDAVRIALRATLFWRDGRLQWSPNEYGSTSTLFLHSNEVWLPDLALLNSFDGDMDTVGSDDGALVTLRSNGTVSWNFWMLVVVHCTILDETSKDFEKWKCSLDYGSLTYSTDKLNYVSSKNGTFRLEQGQTNYSITGTTIDTFDVLDCCPEVNYSHIIISMDLQKAKSHVEGFHGSIILPCIALSLLILLQFLIPPNIGERVVYGILVLIFFTAFAYFVSDLEIQFGIHDCWFPTMLYIFALILGAIAALTNTCLVVNFHHAKHNIVMHPYFKKVLIDYLPKLMLIPDANRMVEREMSEKRRSTKRRQPVANNGDVDDAAGALLSSGDEVGTAGVGGGRPTPAESLTLRYLADIARELRELSREVVSRVVESRGSPQWTCAAEALNRLGLVMVGLYTFLCHLVAIIYYWTL